ncbi:hypothetical protein TNCV_1863891 [Trichonephila clavipes]|nr:hypothetical protein TNCV_1863891 [Trichonephila clavipes]
MPKAANSCLEETRTLPGKWGLQVFLMLTKKKRLRKNLMSGPMLDQNGLKFIGENGQIKVYAGNKLIFKANLEQGLYYACPNIEPKYASCVEKAIKIEGKPNDLMTWHERFCHTNVDYILKTSHLDASIECTRSKAPLNLLHCNVWGPANAIGIKPSIRHLRPCGSTRGDQMKSEGEKPAAIHRRMVTVYEEKCVSDKSVRKRSARFRAGRVCQLWNFVDSCSRQVVILEGVCCLGSKAAHRPAKGTAYGTSTATSVSVSERSGAITTSQRQSKTACVITSP